MRFYEQHNIEQDILLSKEAFYATAESFLKYFSKCVSFRDGQLHLYRHRVPYGSAREFCEWVKAVGGFSTPSINEMIYIFKDCMPSHNQEVHRQETRLYKAIAHVFEGRVDLNAKQKHDLILECYNAAKAEMHLEVECEVARALQGDRDAVPFHQVSFGRRCP